MSDPTIEEVAHPDYWACTYQCNTQSQVVGALTVASRTALRSVLNELDPIFPDMGWGGVMESLDSIRDRIRAALGEGKVNE